MSAKCAWNLLVRARLCHGHMLTVHANRFCCPACQLLRRRLGVECMWCFCLQKEWPKNNQQIWLCWLCLPLDVEHRMVPPFLYRMVLVVGSGWQPHPHVVLYAQALLLRVVCM